MGVRQVERASGLWLLWLLCLGGGAIIVSNGSALKRVLAANLEVIDIHLDGPGVRHLMREPVPVGYLLAIERGRRALSEDDLKRALGWLEQARVSRPDSVPVRFFLGQCYARLGETSRAVAEFGRTRLADPSLFPSRRAFNYLIHWAWLSTVAMRNREPGNRDWKAVEEIYLVVRALYRSDRKSWESLFEFYQYSVQDGDALIRTARAAKGQFPSWVLPYLKTADVYAHRNQPQLALAELERATEVDPFNETVFLRAAHLLHRQRDFAAARIWKERALRALPESESVLEAYQAVDRLEALSRRSGGTARP